MDAIRTLVSVIALYRLSVWGPNVFWSGTTRVGTVAVGMLIPISLEQIQTEIPFGLRRRNEGEKFSPAAKSVKFEMIEARGSPCLCL
jgi:hypothetical protein